MGELGYSLSLYQDSMGYIISPRNRSQGTTKVLRKSVCIPWLYSVSLSVDSILIDIMINQIKAPFVPLKGNLPSIRNFLERSVVLPASAHLHKVYPIMWLISEDMDFLKIQSYPQRQVLGKLKVSFWSSHPTMHASNIACHMQAY